MATNEDSKKCDNDNRYGMAIDTDNSKIIDVNR
jgi:hypothetical protein